MTVRVPPLKCQGIKTKLVEWIKDHAILENDGTWIEPFMGSGVVGFNVGPNRACFNGVMRFNKKGAFNVPFGHKPERFAKAYITKITNQIKYVADALSQYDWQFVCQDFRKTISSASQDDFVYCDPPYIGRHVDYFNSWSEQ